MADGNCNSCGYSWNDPKRGHALFCRRYPPTVEMKEFPNQITGKMDSAVVATYPPVQEDGWCGEHDGLSPVGPIKFSDA